MKTKIENTQRQTEVVKIIVIDRQTQIKSLLSLIALSDVSFFRFD
jgi:hypothetical protein